MNITKTSLKALLVGLVFGALAVAVIPASTYAASCTYKSGDDKKELKTSLISCDERGGNPIMSIILQVTNFLAVGVGIAVVGGITWGAMLYTTSNGDASKAQQGITVIVNAVIGLLLFIFMYAIIDALVPGGFL